MPDNGDFRDQEEQALREARAVMRRALRRAGMQRKQLAARLGVQPAAVTQALDDYDDASVSIRRVARYLAACGYRLTLGAEPLATGPSEPSATR